ncbi:MAG: hypothetical protein RR186_00535 [Raoultibacter sp.]
MFQKLGRKLSAFMVGRNGVDGLGRFFLGVAFFLLVVGLIVPDQLIRQIITVVSFGCILYCYYRMLSRKVGNRYKENCAYARLRTKLTKPFRGLIAHGKEWKTYHKTHKIYRCKECGQSLRVPKGKGKIKVVCPKCKTSFIAKS